MKNDVLAARMNKIERFLSDGRELAIEVVRRKRISRSRVRKLEEYRVYFNALESDAVFSRLAEHSTKILDELIELIALNNAGASSDLLNAKADEISKLVREVDKILDEIEREASLNGVWPQSRTAARR